MSSFFFIVMPSLAWLIRVRRNKRVPLTDGERQPMYEALIGSTSDNHISIAAKVDTGQVDFLGRLLQTYHGTDGSARLMTLKGDVKLVTPMDIIHDEPRSIYPSDNTPEDPTEAFDMIAVMGDVEEVDKVFLYVDGAWREGTRIPDSCAEYLWRTAD